MHLLPKKTPEAVPAAPRDVQSVSAAPSDRTDGPAKKPKPAAKKSESEPAAPAYPAVDYTVPVTPLEIQVDMQRRIEKLEGVVYRKLTAGEYAIAVEAMTGQSLETWQRQGYVVEMCPCVKPVCKGWRMMTISQARNSEKMNEPVTDIPVPTVTAKTENLVLDRALVLGGKFQQMFVDGRLKKGKHDSTIIPKDGPMTWTHEEQLAFAQGFDMDDLLTLEGKPRELQRQLIASLRAAGYDILSGEKS